MVVADSSTNVGNNREISSYLEFSSDDDNAYYTHVKRKREGGVVVSLLFSNRK